MSSSALVECQSIGLRYNRGPETLSDITLSLREGSFTFLTGPSGSGKTSLMNILSLRLRPTRGVMTIFGQSLHGMDVHQLAALRRHIGVVFQDFRLVPHMTAYENVALPVLLKGGISATAAADVKDLLQWVGLGDQMHQLPATLSGGQQQRVAIARAVINRPRLLLADEPTGNLDDVIGERLLLLLEQLNKRGTTIVIATHSQHMLSRFPYPRYDITGGRMTAQGVGASAA